ncbi:MAG: hypothetical protein ACRDTH_25790 [Pseudonocardiaceae bacterium]
MVLRQALLRDLSVEGLLAPAVRPRLEVAGARTLLDWNAAAAEASRYLTGAGRRRYLARSGPGAGVGQPRSVSTCSVARWSCPRPWTRTSGPPGESSATPQV